MTCTFDYVAFENNTFDVCAPEAGAWYPIFTPAPIYDDEEDDIILAAWRELNNYYGQ